LGIFNSSNDLIRFIDNNVENTLKILCEYNGNVNNFKSDIFNWRISCFKEYEIDSLFFNKNYNLSSKNNNININFKLKFNDNGITTVNNNDDEMINKIFMSESENINCNLMIPINKMDTKIISNIGTETLVKECLIDENKLALKRRLEQLEAMKKNEIDRKTKEIEKEMRINKEKEEEYLRKFLVDRKLYFVFKQEIKDGQRENDNIPKLYLKQWQIFKDMEENNDLDMDNKIINDQNTNIIQKELCIYRELDNKYKNVIFDSKYDGVFKSGEPKRFTKVVNNDSDNSSSSDSDEDELSESDNSEDEESEDENIIGPLIKSLRAKNNITQ
jgi:hypothetical protein